MEMNSNQLKFYGDGGKYFGIVVVNLVLTLVTLGLYYPWARAKNLQYLYGETEFAGSRFTFHGTGREMFKGFIKAMAIIGVLFVIYFTARLSDNTATVVMGFLVYVLGIITVIPLAIHGGLRYRMSRTSWRGIHFGYRGNLRELLTMYFKGMLLSIFTLGIYTSWFTAELRRYITGNIRLGNINFRFDGEGKELFIINLKGILLLYPTLGIYTFWWMKNLNHYHINHMHLEQDGQSFAFQSNLSAGDIFMTGLTNNLLILFTLGLGTPWAILRAMRMVIDNAELAPGFNPDAVFQTEEVFTDATGDDVLSMLDIGLDF
jgi:uncharacterized membrane protein YjgN (DUF898 family)